MKSLKLRFRGFSSLVISALFPLLNSDQLLATNLYSSVDRMKIQYKGCSNKHRNLITTLFHARLLRKQNVVVSQLKHLTTKTTSLGISKM